jgi:hypothetical protein
MRTSLYLLAFAVLMALVMWLPDEPCRGTPEQGCIQESK